MEDYTEEKAMSAVNKQFLDKFKPDETFTLSSVKQLVEAAVKIGFIYGQKSAS